VDSELASTSKPSSKLPSRGTIFGHFSVWRAFFFGHYQAKGGPFPIVDVRIEQDRTIYLFFNVPIDEEMELAPVVVFSDWNVTAAEWVC